MFYTILEKSSQRDTGYVKHIQGKEGLYSLTIMFVWLPEYFFLTKVSEVYPPIRGPEYRTWLPLSASGLISKTTHFQWRHFMAVNFENSSGTLASWDWRELWPVFCLPH
jgi:hypothetical protein